ncbi:hypothetical protein Hypma_006391 [Hypsizygus marmoreus]|uniref:Uncharacterized protein n=1 Tax=Hypsizygus marmoreus TaxID=39966 RepID=A0A369JUJ7_HYPMA|nr:hypothetical protein Hypma_006391 [Hypsizygus marmoreus]
MSSAAIKPDLPEVVSRFICPLFPQIEMKPGISPQLLRFLLSRSTGWPSLTAHKYHWHCQDPPLFQPTARPTAVKPHAMSATGGLHYRCHDRGYILSSN